MSTKRIYCPWQTVYAPDTTGGFQPATAWSSTLGLEKVRVVFEMEGKFGNVSLTPAYQVADDVTNPPPATTHTAVGSAVTADGYTIQTSFTAVSETKLYIRFGWLVKLTSGTDPGMARASGRWDAITQ